MQPVFRKKQKSEMKEVAIEEAFPFLCEKKHIISLVGGGGKTTLMYLLAERYRQKGFKTLITTTTHIERPVEKLWVHSKEELEQQWKRGQLAVVGEECEEEKITGVSGELLNAYLQDADSVLIEADGAKRMACKVPNDTEPVLLPQSDLIIGVMGLDVIGRTLLEACFRPEQAVKLLQVPPEHRITEEDLVKILTDSGGTCKGVGRRTYYVVLNKCDDAKRQKSGEKILELLEKQGITQAVLTRLR